MRAGLLALALGATACGTGLESDAPDSSADELRRRRVVDAGSSTQDAGAPVVDAGASKPDAGTPVVDAGSSTPDAGTPAVDAGPPAPDAGSGSTGATAAGAIPAGLPSRLSVGLFEEQGGTWMKSSGARWDMRYTYFTFGWLNNWGWSPADGSWGLSYMRECDSQGFVPAIAYYVMNGEPGGGESAFLAKAQNATTMADYFNQFKVLMQRAKDFGKPVVVMLEGDGFGYLEQQSGTNNQAYAAVAASGLPELAGLPNTVAGWGLAFLQLRKAVGATNAVLGMHISDWADNYDIGYFTVTDNLQPHVDTVYNFLAPLGLAANQTGATMDFLVGDPLDRDADFYRLTQGQDRWWDASDSASIYSKSFNRYAEWMRLWNLKSGKRWVLWQIPLGNSNSPNVSNPDNGSAGGYKDNRTEYFFKDYPLTGSVAHLKKFAASGAVALLFGRGATGQASYNSDFYSDGQLFLKSRAAPFLAAGGLPIH